MGKQDFFNKWTTIGEEHIKADISNKGKYSLGDLTSDFLFNLGIPSEFGELNFDYLREKKLETVNKRWALRNTGFNKYLAIGFNGAGDPITINLDNQKLVYLNHDNNFEEILINSDLQKFAYSIVLIDEFILGLQKLNSKSFFKTEFSDDQLKKLTHDLREIDPSVFINKSSHWKYTLDYYLWERNNERERCSNKK